MSEAACAQGRARSRRTEGVGLAVALVGVDLAVAQRDRLVDRRPQAVQEGRLAAPGRPLPHLLSASAALWSPTRPQERLAMVAARDLAQAIRLVPAAKQPGTHPQHDLTLPGDNGSRGMLCRPQ